MPWLILEAKKITRNSSLKTIVHFGLADNFGLLHSGQIKSEIHTLLSIVKTLSPKVIVEIGTAAGGTLFMLSRVLEPKGILISIDLPYGKFGGGYHVWKIPLYKSFATEKQKIYLLRADSHKLMTFNKLKQLLDKQLVDFLFIDGDHSAKGVMKDFKMYSGLVKKGGLIAFHDIVSCGKSSDCKVDVFWNKIKRTYQHQEIIHDESQEWGGIGILKW
ncbi:methyltransferase [Candidatus Roizmanbacteria bacterium CG09_land_8_20_14_0_10_41_9]|uniref:Methyltransferase n=1 Tax=Candidatus Roizmanbacteria bacterium CG09_land_8_20_14_0_10_41_9 TaxID=1974850 RepID=A0A2H0WVC1_9BACT|nr:MAG: methyltransferase [Candidatus Roizmanbacteria bacterium CG09_land_8_20_14_0_10_41_9]